MELHLIKQYVDTESWYHVNGTETYINEADIFLTFSLGEWEACESSSLPENIKFFLQVLSNKQVNNKINCCSVAFKYRDQILSKIDLYKFVGEQESNRSIKQATYFAKPLSKKHYEKIEDIFTVALIKEMNDEVGLSFVENAIGSIE